MEEIPPGQRVIPNFIIYRILGQPEIRDLSSYRLTIDGMVENPVSLTYEELLKLVDKRIKRDFHCVTGWSVKEVTWEGVSTRKLIDMVKPLKTVDWVYIESLDGYSTIVPYQDFNSEDALIAVKMNGEPLTPEHGFPARIVIPHLYGWKSAKWIHKIVFREDYVDGYWEALGYHERGNVWMDERFKAI